MIFHEYDSNHRAMFVLYLGNSARSDFGTLCNILKIMIIERITVRVEYKECLTVLCSWIELLRHSLLIRKIDITSLHIICIIYYNNVNSKENMVLCGIGLHLDKNLEQKPNSF